MYVYLYMCVYIFVDLISFCLAPPPPSRSKLLGTKTLSVVSLHTWCSSQTNGRTNGWMDWWHATLLKAQHLEYSTSESQVRWQLFLPLVLFCTDSLDCLGRWSQKSQGCTSTSQLPIPERAFSGERVLFLAFLFSSALWVNIFSSSEREDQRCRQKRKEAF